MRLVSSDHKGIQRAAGMAIFAMAVAFVFATASANPDGATTVGGEKAFASRADAMITTVDGFLQVKDYESAEKAASELTESYPQYVRGWLMLGYCKSHNERFVESNEAYSKAKELGADTKSVNMRKAYNFVRMHDYEGARECYQKALRLDSNDTEVLKQLGYLEGKLGNLDQASFYYRQILESDPKDTDALTALAKIEVKRGGGSEVEYFLKQMLEVDPTNTEALGKLGVIYIKDKKFQEALEPLGKLVELDPTNAKARRNIGVAYYQLGQKTKAKTEFERARDLGGDMSGLYGPLADCYVNAGASSQAMKVIKAGIAAEEQEAWLYCMWGKILEKSENYDGAIVKFERAANLKEEPWSTYARKQIARQSQLQQRADLISQQGR